MLLKYVRHATVVTACLWLGITMSSVLYMGISANGFHGSDQVCVQDAVAGVESDVVVAVL